MNAPSKVWDRPRNIKGQVVGVIHQWCAVCQREQEKLVAKWPSTPRRPKGHKTYLCPRAIEHDNVDTIHIL